MILPATVFQDLRYGARMLRRDFGFTVVAVLALALGIGVNTAVFTAYKAMVARPIDGRDPTSLVNIALTRNSGATEAFLSYPDYESLRDSARSFTGVIAFAQEHMRLSDAGATMTQRASEAGSLVKRLGLLSSGASNAEFAFVFAVSENYFEVLGVTPLRGRTFSSLSGSELLASPSVVISENYWRKRFASDPAVLGKTLRLNGVAVTIIGIAPHDFVGTHISVPDFWLPLTLEPLLHADEHWLNNSGNQCCRVFARLAPGVGIGEASSELGVLAGRISAMNTIQSESAKFARARVWPGSPFPLPLNLYPGLQLSILLIMAAAGMVLTVACANVGSLQLARARWRQNEIRTRLSLGASPRRIMRQLLTESVLLGVVAGVVALPFAWGFVKIGLTVFSAALPPTAGMLVFEVNPNREIFAYVFAVSLFAGMLFGVAPAMEGSGAALFSAVRSNTSSARSRRIQDWLIAAQVALSLVLMIAGSMCIHSAMNALRAETGYDSRHVFDLELQFPEGAKYNAGRRLAVVNELRTRIGALPGVVSLTNGRPPSDNGSFNTPAATIDAALSSSSQNIRWLHYSYVEKNYFQTLGIPLLFGSGFEAQAHQPEHSLILSQSAAKQLWLGQNPIGRSLRLGAVDERFNNGSGDLRADGPAYQVIGVARDTRGVELNGSDSRHVYLPLPKDRLHDRPMLIRTQADPVHIIGAIDSVISSIDPDLVATYSTLDEILRRSPSFVISSIAAAVATALGVLGLLLALMGIYGTVSYIVALRTREIGIRMAVGAQKRDIMELIIGESARPVFGGLLVGVVLAAGASYALRGLLYGLNVVDGRSFVGVSLLFLAIALVAAYPPSRRALLVDPMVALRYE